MRQNLHLIAIILLALAGPMLGCEKEGTEAGGDAGASGDETGGSGDTDGDAGTNGDESGGSGDTEDAGGQGDTGIVEGVVYRQGEVDHSGVSVTLDGTDHDAVSRATGFYEIENVSPGTYTVTVSAMGYTEETSDPFEVRAEERTSVDPITVEIAIGELAGTVLLEGQDDHSGVVITLEGTSHTAVTDENGSWSIAGVAVGQYRMEATHSRYERGVISDISVLAGQVTTVPSMSLECGADHHIIDGACCDSPCQGMCESCNLAGSEGTCTAHAPGTDPHAECTLGIGCDGVCDGNGGEGEGTCLLQSCQGTLPYRPRSVRLYSDNGDGTVTDEITDLMWTQRTEGSPSWDKPEAWYSWEEAFLYCDNLDFAGHSDWRLPDRYELSTLVDYAATGSRIDVDAFPQTPPWSFWSSSSAAGREQDAWCVDFGSGTFMRAGKGVEGPGLVRCVRLGPLDVGAFTAWLVADDRVVDDTATNLVWQGCAAGQSGGDCTAGEAMTYTWEEAFAFCETLSWGGFDDWRLPDRTELATTVDATRSAPAIYSDAFPATPSSPFWSSSSSFCPSGAGSAWKVDYREGSPSCSALYLYHNVRCVRLGPGAGSLGF